MSGPELQLSKAEHAAMIDRAERAEAEVARLKSEHLEALRELEGRKNDEIAHWEGKYNDCARRSHDRIRELEARHERLREAADAVTEAADGVRLPLVPALDALRAALKAGS